MEPAATPAGNEGAAGGGQPPPNPFTGAQGGATETPAADPGGAPPSENNGSDAGESGAYYPEALPEQFRGESDRETIDKMLGGYSSLQQSVAERGTVPENPDGYKLEFGDDLKKIFGDPAKDARTQVFRTLAHKYGMTDKDAAGFYTDYHQELVSEGLVDVVDRDAEVKALVGEKPGMTIEQMRDEAGQRYDSVSTWLDGLVNQGVIDKDQRDIAYAMQEVAGGIKLLEGLKGLSREHGPQGGGEAPVAMSKADLDKMANDPRANPMDPRYEEKFWKDVQSKFQNFYSNGQANG